MNFRILRASVLVTSASLLVMVAAACTAAAPTPIYIYTTATPRPTAPPTPVPTPTPVVTPTPVPTDTPTPGPATPSPTAKPTPTQSIGPKGPAGSCSGDAAKQAFFADAANKLPFSVYCGALPGGWVFSSASYTQPNGGVLTVTYKGPGGAQLVLKEGAFCLTSATACAPHDKVLGTAKFSDLPATLNTLGSAFVVYAAPGTAQAYSATGTGLAQGAFSGLVVGLAKVPRS